MSAPQPVCPACGQTFDTENQSPLCDHDGQGGCVKLVVLCGGAFCIGALCYRFLDLPTAIAMNVVGGGLWGFLCDACFDRYTSDVAARAIREGRHE